MFEYQVKEGKVILQKEGKCYLSVPLEKWDEFFASTIEAYKAVLKENEKNLRETLE